MAGKSEIAIVFLATAVVVAIWCDTRWAARRPQSLGHALVHLLIATTVNMFPAVIAGNQLAASGLPLARLGAIVIVALPALVYVLVAVLWLLRLVQSLLPRPSS